MVASLEMLSSRSEKRYSEVAQAVAEAPDAFPQTFGEGRLATAMQHDGQAATARATSSPARDRAGSLVRDVVGEDVVPLRVS